MTNHLKGVEFSIWSGEDIKKQAVCEVFEKKTSEKGVLLKNGLRDARMGPIQGKCTTCGLNKGRCPGHFGYIELSEHVFHISWVTNVLHWLKCICFHCGEVIIKDIKESTLDVPRSRQMHIFVKNLHIKCPKCENRQPKYSWNKDKQQMLMNNAPYATEDILRHLNHVTDEKIKEMSMSHPRDMLLKILPVPPPNVRPPIMAGNAIRGEDDLTYRLLQILRANDKLKKMVESKRPSHIIANARESLQISVTGYINHTKLSNARKRSSKREYTSLTARLTKKEGRIRGNLMGKRCDYTARSVITGDDSLGMHEVGIPISVAEKLTIPVKVTDYNKKNMQALLEQEKSPVKYVIRPNGSRVDLSFVSRLSIQLSSGYTVERSLQDGDIVLFNRQPSLHKMSIMAHEVRVLPYSTFRMNLSCTTPYNADFDGDEMNVHAPQTLEAMSEARHIMAVKYQVVSPQSNSPVMSVIQDSLVGAYLLSNPSVRLTREEMMQCAIDIPGWNGKMEEKDIYEGKDLISMVLPLVNWKRNDVEILRGKLIRGQLSKKVLGKSQGSLIHVMYNDCGPNETILFIHRLQKVVHRYLTIRGFSLGISDIMTAQSIRDRVHEERTNAFKDIANERDELKINERLNICRDSMGKMVQEPLNDTNNFFCTVNSGSKGSSINISQIMAVVGQQNLCGKRIPQTWTERTLPHFPRGNNGPLERGFIQHSYVEGLSPAEVWYHAIAGREGMIDTACKTSVTGYIERRFIKALENIKIHWDGTVRNSDKVLIQFKYGDDGYDAMRVEKQQIHTYEYPTEELYGGIDEEYKQILEDHYFLQDLDKWKDPSLQGSSWYMLPINISRIIHNTKTLFGFPSRDVTVEEVYEAMQKLLKTIGNKMLQILIRSEMNSNKLVHRDKINKDNLDLIVHEIKKQYDMIHSIAGESVGAVAAQSLGEPCTQMTLNTFHFAGVSSMNVTLGVPRLEEIINCTKGDKMKTIITSFTCDDMKHAVKTLRHITMNDLVDSYTYTEHPNDEEVASFHIFPDPEYRPAGNKTLVLYLKEWYNVNLIKRVIYKSGKLVCAYTDGPRAIFHVSANRDHASIDLAMYYEQILKKETVRGVVGAEFTKIVHLPGQLPHIQTSLPDLKTLFSKNLGCSSIYTNNIHEIANTYGIEAARAAILKEIRSILSFYGIYVNIRHILVLIDWMTSYGKLTPLTRHGIRNVDASPLKRSTFEEVVEVFNQAACFNETDNLDGISECIIAGVPPNIGGKLTECIKDEVIERENAIPRPESPKQWQVSNGDDFNNEVNPWGIDESESVSNGSVPHTGFPFGSVPGSVPGTVPGASGGNLSVFDMPRQDVFNPIQNPFTPVFQQPPGGMFYQPPQQPGAFYQPPPQQPGAFYQPPQQPGASMARPPSPAYDPTKSYAPDSPMSPAYDPNHAPDSPMSPAYDPTKSYAPDSPMSPAYDPNHAPDSPMSPAYDPTKSYGPDSPMSPAYDPDHAPDSPMSPAYDSTKSYRPTSPTYDPNCAPDSPMSPAYNNPLGQVVPAYDPSDPMKPPLPSRKRKQSFDI